MLPYIAYMDPMGMGKRETSASITTLTISLIEVNPGTLW